MKYNISNITPKNQVQLVKTGLLACLCVAITVSVKPVYAADSQVRELSDISSIGPVRSSRDLTSETENVKAQLNIESLGLSQSLMKPQLIAKTDSSRIMTASELLTVELGQPLIVPLQPQFISQTDSSGSVGDTFGESNKLRQDLLIEPIVETTKTGGLTAAPGSAAGTPTAYGANWRQAFIGAGFFFPFNGDVDGSLSLGFGLGDAAKSVGLEIATNIISVGGQKPNFGDFADSGTVGFKLHKSLSDGTAVAFGWSNAIKWGEADIPQETLYGVITKPFDKLTVSLGVGSGSYRSKGALKSTSNDNDPNLFGSLGYRVIPQASLVTSWTGSAWNLGASFVPLKNGPVVVNAIFTDVTDNVNNSGFSLTAGYSFQF